MIMVLLTVLGTAAIMTSTTDVKISENFKKSSNAFYAAEAGIEAGMNYLGTYYDSANGWNDELTTSSTNGYILDGVSIGTNTYYRFSVADDETANIGWDVTDEDATASCDGGSSINTCDSNRKILITAIATYGGVYGSSNVVATTTLQAYVEFDQGYDSYGGRDLTSGNTSTASGTATWGS